MNPYSTAAARHILQYPETSVISGEMLPVCLSDVTFETAKRARNECVDAQKYRTGEGRVDDRINFESAVDRESVAAQQYKGVALGEGRPE